MTTTQPAPEVVGLRERKRREVRARIEEAAVFLVLRDGLEATTVDAISERADISPRTFFNYFDSKDAALLGLPPGEGAQELPAELLELQAGEDLAESVVRVLASAMGGTLASRTKIHLDRRELLKRHPQVLASQFAQLVARNEQLTAVIEGMLARSPRHAGSEHDRSARAEVLLSACGGALRVAAREWVAAGSPDAVQDVERRAVALINQIVRTLA